jgi:hypothetical protein
VTGSREVALKELLAAVPNRNLAVLATLLLEVDEPPLAATRVEVGHLELRDSADTRRSIAGKDRSGASGRISLLALGGLVILSCV